MKAGWGPYSSRDRDCACGLLGEVIDTETQFKIDSLEGQDVQEYPLPSDMHVREDYRVFPLELEDNPLVVFHGTALANFAAIVAEGFKRGIDVGATLESISYAKGSSSALTHWVGRREVAQDGIILALRFESFQGLHEEAQIVYDYKTAPTQPKIIGYVVVTAAYCHR